MKKPPFNSPAFSGVFGEAFGKVFGPEVSAVPFSPLDIPGLLGWYDATDPATISGEAGSVQNWLDKSGNGNDLAAPTEGQRPITGTQTINGLNTIFFDGEDDSLEISPIITTPDFTVAIVFNVIGSITSVNDSIFSLNSNEGGNADFQLDAGDSSEFFGRFNSTNLDVATDISTDPDDLLGDDSGLLWRLSVGDGTSDLFNSAGIVDTSTGYNGQLDNSQFMRVGLNRGGSFEPLSKIGEVVVVNDDISSADRIKLFNYFARWGV